MKQTALVFMMVSIFGVFAFGEEAKVTEPAAPAREASSVQENSDLNPEFARGLDTKGQLEMAKSEEARMKHARFLDRIR